MPLSPDLSTRLYENVALGARGGLYKNQFLVDGQEASRWFTQLLISARFNESVVEAARSGTFVLDNHDPAILQPLHAGSLMQFFGYTVDPDTGTVRNTEGERLFSGICFEDSRHDSPRAPTRTYVAYDLCTLLARDESIKVWPAGTTMSSMLRDIAAETGLTLGTVVETGVEVGQIVMGAGTAPTWWGALTEASRRTWDKSGRRFFVRAREGSGNFVPAVELLELGRTGVTWHVGDGPNGILTDFGFTESAEGVRTEIIGVAEDPENTQRVVVKATASEDGIWREVFGRLRKHIAPDFTDLTQAQIQTRVNQELANTTRTVQKATTSGLLIPSARRGDAVVLSSRTGVTSRWYIETLDTRYAAGHLEQSMTLILDLRDA